MTIRKHFLPGISLVRNNLLATLPTWGPTYKVSFDCFINSYKEENPKGSWAEILRFTSTTNDCCGIGDRLPAIFSEKNQSVIQIGTQIGDNGLYTTKVELQEKIWYQIEVVQYPQSSTKVIKSKDFIKVE